MAKKSEKSAYNPHWGIRIFIVVLVGVLLAVSVFLFEDRIDSALGFNALSEHTDENVAQSGDSQNQDSQGDSSETGGSAKEDLNVHFVDVGQGDACIVELPDDKTMIIDGGDRDAKDALLDYIKQTLRTTRVIPLPISTMQYLRIPTRTIAALWTTFLTYIPQETFTVPTF